MQLAKYSYAHIYKNKLVNQTFSNFMSHVVHDNVVRRTVSTRYNAKKRKGEDVQTHIHLQIYVNRYGLKKNVGMYKHTPTHTQT